MADLRARGASGRGLKPQALGLSTTALILLRDLIEQHTGQYFDDQKLDLLADKIADIVTAHGFTSLLDYYYLLKYDADAETHWRRLLDKLAVPETYFWRQADQIIALIEHVVPEHARTRPGQPLRIWSAACCTGEEPLSIAMALDREGWFERMTIEIVGTDASEAMVERANRGAFGERAMRTIPPDLQERYFSRSGKLWQINGDLHARVKWGRVNLAEEAEVAPHASADVVYCRNVLIYFSDEAIQDVAGTFARHMPGHGVLFLGASESLLRLSTDFQMIELGTAFAYTPLAAADGAFSPPGSLMRDKARGPLRA